MDPTQTPNPQPQQWQNPTAAAVQPPAAATQDATAGLAQDPQTQGQPQSAPAARPQPTTVVVPGTPSAVAGTPNKGLHRFISGVLGAMAGEAPKVYTTDANGTPIPAPNQPVDTTADKVKRIFSHALAPLAAPEDPNAKSALAKGLTGLGQGFGIVKQQMSAEDQAAQQKARQGFEDKQNMMLRQMEIGKANALTSALWYGHIKQNNELPDLVKNRTWFESLQDSEDFAPHAHEMTGAEAAQREKADPTFTQTHVIRPLRWEEDLDENGNQVMIPGSDGRMIPKDHLVFGVVDGTKDGKMAVTPHMVEDYQKYGKKIQIPGLADLKAGDEYDFDGLTRADNKIRAYQKKEMDGWAKFTVGWGGPDHKTPMQVNSFTGEVRAFPEEVVPNVANKPAESAGKVAKLGAEAKKAGAAVAKTAGAGSQSADRNALTQAAKTANLKVTVAKAKLQVAQKANGGLGDPEGIKSAQAELDSAAKEYQDNTAKLALKPGEALIYDPQGTPHAVPSNKVDAYLKDPAYKGWTK